MSDSLTLHVRSFTHVHKYPFNSLKSLTQYLRRKSISKFKIYKGNTEYIVFNERLIPLDATIQMLQQKQRLTL